MCWWNQKSRCERPERPDYKQYGAKGIRVLYQKEEFVEWYIKQMHGRNIDTKWHVGRKDHSLHYSFDNVELVVARDNMVESSNRNSKLVGDLLRFNNHSKKYIIVDTWSGFAEHVTSLCGIKLAIGIDRGFAARLAKSSRPYRGRWRILSAA